MAYLPQVQVPDMSDRYNTQLPPDQERAYQQWVAQQSTLSGRDMSKDTYNYDLRGLFAGGGGVDERGHSTDRFKKPNHPTFSDQSQYHGVEGSAGGNWVELDGGGVGFVPGPTNLQYYSPNDLRRELDRAGDSNVVLMPRTQ